MTMTETRTTPTLVLTIDESQSFIAGVKAAANAASKDAARPVLTNILFHVGDGEIRMVATDSYRLHVVTLGPFIDMPASWDFDFMLDAKQVVAALPKRKPLIQLEFRDDDVRLSAVGDGIEVTLVHQPGTYPQWENLIKRDEKPGDPFTIGLNPKFVAEIAKAADIFRGKTDIPLRFTLGQTEMKPCYWDMSVVDRGTFFGLLMPVRIG